MAGRWTSCALLGLALAPAALARTPGERVELVEVVDGDGLLVRRGGRLESLRLACVDCEEALHASDRAPRDKPQTVLGERARLWLAARLAEVPELELEVHPGEARDGFGRLLAHARVPGGEDLSLALVRAGHSPYFVKYGTCPLADAALDRAEREARAACGAALQRLDRLRVARSPRRLHGSSFPSFVVRRLRTAREPQVRSTGAVDK